ncbi:sigma-70 family RNA polymerase sigma factor [Kitasatospora aureofaciens]|uniref:Uncharacterized protein n=1 Tax=Kitasatospora aureofaciens TaxID=1894 RepID=A0A1E7NAU5_KITAU|nr:sigma-70 family RNA polymerase sigma factor [Kitasatospora aureofaciens]ARF78078.1 hypothetical protein B6264_03330 [Kitasatospora aureofaciens]OEV37788.1 hypothetical protein HS99_0024670 [Kitasatospora aureofaciens]GGV07660.1 hypothetical protein GCM10010502_73400 [Kitasatospora aureofaciens]
MNFRTISDRPVEPLQLVELEMQRLVERPVPLALYVGDLGEGLPDSWLDMAALRTLLLHPSVGFQARGAVWVRLLHLTRAGGQAGEDWRAATCAMALPGLWRIAGRMRREVPELAVEVQQVMLAGFWEALTSLRERAHAMTAPGTIPASLCWAADRAARTFRNQETGHIRRTAELGEQETQQAAAPNPEAVLELAIGQGVLSRDTAELIARTRLEGMPVRVLAEQRGCTPESLGMKRRRAEVKLAEAIRSGRLDCTATVDLMTER